MQRLSTPSNSAPIRACLTIHSSPSALRHHIDWAIQGILGNWITLKWITQPLMPGTFRTQLEFREKSGAASQIASALRSWHYLNFEIFESGETGGELFRFTPELGIHRAQIDLSGAVLLNENQVTQVLSSSFDEESIREGLSKILGTPWENELAKFRRADSLDLTHLRAI